LPDGTTPSDDPFIQPGTTPSTAPSLSPAFTPGTFPVGSNTGVAIGKCTGSCVAVSSTSAATKGISGKLDCLNGCTKSARQPTNLQIPLLQCQGALVQADCDHCFFLVKCDNVFGLSAALLDAIFGPNQCICVPTLEIGCPNCHRSKKGLLGLLGLLGLIPLILCLCLLFLCCIRRRKRQQDVHFATFDPAAANLAMPASHIAPCGPPPPCF